MTPVFGLERGAAGFFILEILEVAGWKVSVTATGEGGVHVCARRGEDVVERVGDTVTDIALIVFEEARAITRAARV